MNILSVNCPICTTPLVSQPGTQIDPNDGVTVDCRNSSCPMSDWGHGKTEKDAIGIFLQKCEHSLKNSE
jgi:hypothetical protein